MSASVFPSSLKKFAWLSIATAIGTIVLKGVAWQLTGSVGLLSDAVESLVNLAGAVMALAMLTLAGRPADAGHAHGHGKAEYFSSGFEGLLVLLAASAIGYTSVERLMHPQPVEAIGLGLAVSVVASGANLLTARVLMRAGRKHESITLEADAEHLMTDVWTSAGVIFGVGLVWITGWLWLDPAVALVVAANILWTGWHILKRSWGGLMDASLPKERLQVIERVLVKHRERGLEYHALRSRQAGSRVFVTVHVMVPGHWTVQEGHDASEQIEQEIRDAIPRAHLTIHLEPLEDPRSLGDQELDRSASAQPES